MKKRKINRESNKFGKIEKKKRFETIKKTFINFLP